MEAGQVLGFFFNKSMMQCIKIFLTFLEDKLEDPNMEIVRMSELPILYRTLYDMDTLPKKVLEELSEMSGQKKGICHGEVCQTLISGICNITKLYHFQSKPSLYLHTSFRL